MGKILSRILMIIAGGAIVLTSCDTDGCTENQSSLPLAGFYSSTTGGQVSLDSLNIGGVGAPNDSLLLETGTTAQQIYLPLRSTASSTAFFINYAYKSLDNAAFNDTIWLDYTADPYFVSEECGAMYRYEITTMRHTTHLIDSVILLDSLITNIDIERLRIYFRTASAEE